MKILKTSLLLLFLGWNWTVVGQQLVYQPINPNFGGSPVNYNWLLSSANAQNQFKDNNQFQSDNSVLGTFSDSVKRQVLNQMSRNFLGDEGMEEAKKNINNGNGTFEAGGLVIKVNDTRNGPVITIIDIDTGESTEIIL